MIKKKLISSYSLPVQKAIHLVSIESDVNPVGSFAYKLAYPGDIDIREKIVECCTEQEVVKKIAQDIKNLVRNIIGQPGYYLADFKAGLDERYPSDSNAFIIRWNEHDLLRGYKILPGNYRVDLERALLDPTIVKLDIWAPIEGRYVEVSNFMIIEVEEPDGVTYPLNGLQPDYIESIKGDVDRYFNKDNLNAFKATKRMLLLAIAYEDGQMIEKIVPLINSNLGLMYQLVGDINTIVDMVEKLDIRSPYEYFYMELDNMKNRLSFIYDFDFNEQDFDAKINMIVKNKVKGEQLIHTLDYLINNLLDTLNKLTLSYDELHGIAPPPSGYCIICHYD